MVKKADESAIHVPNDSVSAVLLPWRIKLLTIILRVAIVISVPALVAGVVAALDAGVPIVAAVNITVYLSLFPLYRARLRFFSAVTVAFCIAILVLAGTLLIVVGPVSAAVLWLILPVALAGLLLRWTMLYLVWGVTLVLALGVTLALYLDALPWSEPMSVWLTVIGSYVAIMIMLSVSVRYLLVHLAQTVHHGQAANSSLRRIASEKEALLQEVHHRVRNNLQVISSMLSMHQDTAESRETSHVLEVLGSRIAAMALAYNYLQTGHGLLRVEIQEVLRIIVEDFGYRRAVRVPLDTGEQSALGSLEQATALALIVTEGLAHYTGGAPIAFSLRCSDGVLMLYARPHSLFTALPSTPRAFVYALLDQIGATLQERPDTGEALITTPCASMNCEA